MKILLFHNFYRRSGGEDESVRMEASLLSQKGETVINFFENSKRIQRMRVLNKAKSSLRLLYSQDAIRKVLAVVEREKPDVAHVHNVFPLITPSIYIALERAGIPVVQTIRNYRLICPNGLLYVDGKICKRCINGNFSHAVLHRCLHGSFIQSSLYAASIGAHWLLGTFPNHLGTVAALSDFVADLIAPKLGSSKPIHTLPNFIDAGIECSAKDPDDYVLYLGRLSPEKGVFQLVRAFKNNPDVKLKVAGVGPAEKKMSQLIHALGLANIELLGYVEGNQRDELLRHALCLVVPSIWLEPFGRVVLEAYAQNTPVIASRIGGLESLVQNGQTGLLFDPADIDQLSDCIRQLARNRNLAIEMGKNAREVVESHYNPDGHYADLMELYQHARDTNHS